MFKLLLKPDEAGYAIDEPESAVNLDIEGGHAKTRLDAMDSETQIDCQFTLTPEQYQYLRAFYNYNNFGSDPFLMDLVLETAALREYEVRFVPGSWKLDRVQGHSFRVKFKITVESNTTGLDFPAIVAAFQGDALPLGAGTTSTLPKLKLLPDASSFKIDRVDDVITTKGINAPVSRSRVAPRYAETKVEVRYDCTPEEYDYLRAFYHVIGKGSRAFFADLRNESREIVTYFCRMKGGTWKLNRVSHDLHQVKFELQVVPRDAGLDYAEHSRTFVQPNWTAPVYPGNFGGEEFP